MANAEKTAHNIAGILRAVAGKPHPKNFTSAVILAAGASSRMGGDITKQFLTLDCIPIVARTVIEFEKTPCIHEIIVVVKEDELGLYSDFAERYGIKKPFSVVSGGETRQISARLGSDAVSDKAKFICIHDAARCLITPELITKACRGAYLHGASMLAIKSIDTVKIGDKNAFVESTPERKFTWQAQTPQVFKVNAYRGAAYIARDEKLEATDDAILLEHIRIPVKLVEGSRENIKITDKYDIMYAKAILDARAEKRVEEVVEE